MSESETKLNTNPEILLKKRKNADKLRLEKQEQARKKAELLKRKKQQNRKSKFIRAETLVAKHRSTEREGYRIKRITENEKLKQKLQSNDEEPEESDELLQFVVRVPGPHGAKVPSKAKKILGLLRLEHVYTGTFIKTNNTIKPLLRLINPYIVIGTPSLATVRDLIQKRATVQITDSEDNNTVKEVALNDNNLIEEKLGELGIICTEDIIHEIASLGENFKSCIRFMQPMKLNPPVHGWGPLSKLKRIELREEQKNNKVSNAGNAPLNEVNIDDFIAEQI